MSLPHRPYFIFTIRIWMSVRGNVAKVRVAGVQGTSPFIKGAKQS
jgi:hypothetical protein